MDQKTSFEDKCAIMENAMKQATEILASAHEAAKIEKGVIIVARPTCGNGKQYFFKFCLLEDATFKDIKQANKLDKPVKLSSLQQASNKSRL